LLNLPVHGPARPGPAPLLLRAAPVRQEPLGLHRHPYLIAVRQADTFLRRRGTCLAAATRADLEAFLADRPPASAYHKVLKILYDWLAEEERFSPTRSCPPLVTRKGEHPGAREDLNLRPPASHASALSPPHRDFAVTASKVFDGSNRAPSSIAPGSA
jgi:hypothetical protein